MSCLEVNHLTVEFLTDTGRVLAVDDVSFVHERKETLALVGETGCGKSVISLAVLGLLPVNAQVSGETWFLGKNLLKLNEKELAELRGNELAVILQNPSLALNPLTSIGRQIAELYRLHEKAKKKTSQTKTLRLLERMGFREPAGLFSHFPFQFSEGMNQRVLIAAALALSPRVILADEPTKGLDDRLKEEITDELSAIKEEKKSALLLITHDLGVARRIGDRLAVMYAGEIIETAQTADFFREPLHPYSRALMKSLPENGFIPIPGHTPSAVSPPAGCKFHPRCRDKMEICVEAKPRLNTVSGREIKCHLYRS
jgi:peptide/nickel transport system ATP-binding protein